MKLYRFTASEIIILAALLSNLGLCLSAAANRAGTSAEVDDDAKLIVYSDEANTIYIQSLSTDEVVEIQIPVTVPHGVAYDAWNEIVYWAAGQSDAVFYQAKFDGSEIGCALANSFNWTSGVDKIAFDWITGNLYIAGWTWVTTPGPAPYYIAVCNPQGTHCVRIVEYVQAQSLVLNPNEGVMYWSTVNYQGIWRAEMDGSQQKKLVNIGNPDGLAVDLESSRIYWMDKNYKSIKSVDRNGGNQQTLVLFGSGEICSEITFYGGRVYYFLGNNSDSYVYSVSVTGEDEDDEPMFHYYNPIYEYFPDIAVAAKENQPKLRNNDCAGDPCSHVCILARTSGYKCLCPEGADLGSNGKTCEFRDGSSEEG